MTLLGVTVAISALAAARAGTAAPLELVGKIPLGAIQGRIDHFAFDSHRKRLFVAELGNNTVGVIDLEQSKTIEILVGFREPQGIGYVPPQTRSRGIPVFRTARGL